MIAKFPAVVAPEDDDGAVREAFFVQRIKEDAKVGVGIADGGVIAVTNLRCEFRRQRREREVLIFARHVGVGPEFAAIAVSDVGGSTDGEGAGGVRNGLGVVEIPILLRGNERQVGLGNTDRQEEGLVLLFELSEGFSRQTHGLAVSIKIIGNIPGFEGHALALVLGVFLYDVGLGRGLGVGFGFGGHPRCRPGRLIVETAMENLTHTLGEVTVLFEVLADGLDVWQCDAEVRLQVPDAGSVGTFAGHDRRARGGAHGLLAISAVEHHAAFGEAVEVRRFDDGVAVAAQLRAQVIDGDEQDVHLFFLGLGQGG